MPAKFNALARWSGSPGAKTSTLIITLPKRLVRKHRIHAGDRLDVEVQHA